MTFSFPKQICPARGPPRLLNQPTFTKVAKINDRIAEAGEQVSSSFFAPLSAQVRCEFLRIRLETASAHQPGPELKMELDERKITNALIDESNRPS